MGITTDKTLATADAEKILTLLRSRFERRNFSVSWTEIEERLRLHPQKLGSLHQMEVTGGSPEYVGTDSSTGQFIFFDCSDESPAGRRSLCYDDEALNSRKEHKPAGSALGIANEMGIQILSEEDYRQLQDMGTFDSKTSSWIYTPGPVRKLGGALFGDFRYGQVFIYHNGASSYYAARGFRGSLRV